MVFFHKLMVVWWDSMFAGSRSVGVVVIAGVWVGDCLSIARSGAGRVRHGRDRLVHEVRGSYVGFLVWGY